MKDTKSLASDSNRKYYLARVRLEQTMLKFQIASSYVNRAYGATFFADASDNPDILDAIKHKTATGMTISSLYGGSKERYVLCQIRLPHGTNKVQVQIRTSNPVNRPYGLAFSLYQIGLHKSLKSHIAQYETDKTTMQYINRGYEWDMNSKQWVKKTV